MDDVMFSVPLLFKVQLSPQKHKLGKHVSLFAGSDETMQHAKNPVQSVKVLTDSFGFNINGAAQEYLLLYADDLVLLTHTGHVPQMYRGASMGALNNLCIFFFNFTVMIVLISLSNDNHYLYSLCPTIYHLF